MAIELEDATIVIVEDDSSSYLATVDLLRMEGVESVYGCNSGEEVLNLINKLPKIDLFLLDIYMPGSTGYDVIKQIREQSNTKESIVVALTASVMYDDIRRMKEAGFDSIIGKPVRPARFGSQIRKILAGEVLWDWR
jgi:two-component system cell cycle response regulator DivK